MVRHSNAQQNIFHYKKNSWHSLHCHGNASHSCYATSICRSDTLGVLKTKAWPNFSLMNSCTRAIEFHSLRVMLWGHVKMCSGFRHNCFLVSTTYCWNTSKLFVGRLLDLTPYQWKTFCWSLWVSMCWSMSHLDQLVVVHTQKDMCFFSCFSPVIFF